MCFYDWQGVNARQFASAIASLTLLQSADRAILRSEQGRVDRASALQGLLSFFEQRLFSIEIVTPAARISASHSADMSYLFCWVEEPPDSVRSLGAFVRAAGAQFDYAFAADDSETGTLRASALLEHFGLGIPNFEPEDIEIDALELVDTHAWDAWGRDLMGSHCYRAGFLRSVYPVNYLKHEHLTGWGDGSLRELCERDPYVTGSLCQISVGRFIWTVPQGEIRKVRDLARRMGKLVV